MSTVCAGSLLPCVWGSLAPYHHPKYDPLWAACQDHDMVVHFHSGAAPIDDYFGPDTPGAERVALPGGMGIYISEVAWYCARPLTFLLWGGAFERFPRLKVAVTEGTSIWVPPYLELLDQRYSSTHYSQKLGDYRSHLSMKPSEYFTPQRPHRRFVHAAARSRAAPRNRRRQHHVGHRLPAPRGLAGRTRATQMTETFAALPEDEIAAMLGGNAASFYGFDAAKLAPLVHRIGPETVAFSAAAAASRASSTAAR